MAKPRTPRPHCAARAALQAPDRQCRGSRGTPLVFLWGIQRGYSLRKENTPFGAAARTPLPLRTRAKKRAILSREDLPLCPVPRPRRCPPPRTFVQKIKKRRLFQPSLLYLHYCKTFLLPWVAFMRSSLLRIVLRMRRFLGVTSSSSSSARNSRHCSRLICLGGTRRSASSEPEARMFVSCFFLHTLTVMSSCLGD